MNQDKIYDVLRAGALGDALGYAIEFDSWKTIQKRFGPNGLYHWPLDQYGILVASDDTQMTIFAIEALRTALAEAAGDFKKIDIESHSKRSFLRWLQTQGSSPLRELKGALSHDSMWRRRAPGNTCLSSLSTIKSGQPALNDSKGCGAAMRAAPYAVLGEPLGQQAVWDANRSQGYLTHLHLDGHVSASALACMIASAPKNKEELVRAARQAAQMSELHGGFGTSKAILTAIKYASEDLDPEKLCDLIGEGWSGDEAVGVALWAALRSTHVSSAIMIGANHRGDSDSTASMAGQLAAAMFGLSNSEKAMFSRIDISIPMEEEWRALLEIWPASSCLLLHD